MLLFIVGRKRELMKGKPLAFFLSIYTGFNFAMIFSFFGSYAYVYQTYYGFTPKIGRAHV